MIFKPSQLVVYASRHTLLEPGDIVSTGTPAGVGHARKPPRYLRPGETVVACVEGIGCIENQVVLDE